MNPISVFWHRFSKWITNCFSTTKTTCLHREACLPPLPALIRQQRRLAGLRLICSPPEIIPASACLPESLPTFSPHRTLLIARGKITPQPYLFFNLDWRSAPDKAKNPRYRHNAITALANAAVPLVHDLVPLPPISLHLTDYLAPVPGVVPSYTPLKLRLNNSSYPTCLQPQPPHTIPIRPQRAPIPSWVWAGSLREGSTRCALVEVTSRLTPHGTTLMPIRPARCALKLNNPLRMPSYPAPRPPFKHPASSMRSRTWPLRPRSGPTSSCSLSWLSSFALLLLVSLLECPCLLPPSTLLRQSPSSPLPPYPPLALKTS